MGLCEFVESGDEFECKHCGTRRRSIRVRVCEKEQPNGLGDRIERWLSSYGVTQEKYKEVKQKFGLPPTCGCDGRKEWFNKVGAYFGIDPDRYGPHKETK